MKKKEHQELRAKTKKELRELIRRTEEELVKLRIDKGGGKLKDVHRLTKKRHHLARLKTALKEKKLNENI